MEDGGYDVALPEILDASMPRKPLLDFAAGYVQRSVGEFPRQGTGPWQVNMSYRADQRALGAPVEDGVLRFKRAASELRRAA
jgi:hypothetical protein